MSFPHYESYKDSGVEWLGEMPEHWQINLLKHQVRMRYGDALASEIREEGNIEVFGSNGVVGSHSVANTKAPAIIVGRKGSYGKIVWAENGGFVIDTAYSIDTDTTEANLRWVYYALQPLCLDSLSQDTGVPGLAREKAYAQPVVVPPLIEQQSIAAFLDRETAKIDALIAEQQRLISLLKEKRQAVISHAVTKGLSPDATMKDSGIKWLGEVPAHWEVKSLKRAVILQRGHDLPSDNRIEGKIPIVSSGGITGYHNEAITTAPTIITGRYGTIGEFIYVEQNCWPLNTSLYAVEMYNNLPKFLWYMLQAYKEHFVLNSLKAAVPGVDRNDVHPIKITIPHADEQADIVLFLDQETTKLDNLTTEAQRAIELFKERRSALISAAVTGKIDVRGLVETLPESITA